MADEGRSGLGEIAKGLGIPLATAHRLSLALVSEGYLQRLHKGYFIAGQAIAGHAGQNGAQHGAASVLRGPLARLADQHRGFAHFGILEEGMVTYLVKEGTDGDDLFTAERGQLEAYCSAIGKVLLSSLPEDQLETYLEGGPFVALTRNTLTDPDLIRTAVIAVRETSVGFDRREIREDLFCMAVPVTAANQDLIGAISLSLLNHVPEPAEEAGMVRQLRRIAKSAARFLA